MAGKRMCGERGNKRPSILRKAQYIYFIQNLIGLKLSYPKPMKQTKETKEPTHTKKGLLGLTKEYIPPYLTTTCTNKTHPKQYVCVRGDRMIDNAPNTRTDHLFKYSSSLAIGDDLLGQGIPFDLYCT